MPSKSQSGASVLNTVRPGERKGFLTWTAEYLICLRRQQIYLWNGEHIVSSCVRETVPNIFVDSNSSVLIFILIIKTIIYLFFIQKKSRL